MYDLKNLAKLKTLDANAPEGMKAFWPSTKRPWLPEPSRSNTRS
jgi:hypothetical protein